MTDIEYILSKKEIVFPEFGYADRESNTDQVIEAEVIDDSEEESETDTDGVTDTHIILSHMLELIENLNQTVKLQAQNAEEKSHPERGLYVGEEEDEQEETNYGG